MITPADTTTRTLLVYVGGWTSGGKLVAHLSDSSAADFVDIVATRLELRPTQEHGQYAHQDDEAHEQDDD